MRYKHILFDLDDTLIWYNPSETGAIRALMARRGITLSNEQTQKLLHLAWREWDAVNLSRTDLPEINARFHELYMTFRVTYFDRLKELYPLNEPSDQLAKEFYALLAQQSPICENAQNVVETLSLTRTISLATNGMHAIQSSRASVFGNLIANFFVSETVGVAKPDTRFFMRVLERLKARPEDCLMVGDSLSSDIAGAQSAGIDACWIDIKKKGSDSITPTFIINDISELLLLLREDT